MQRKKNPGKEKKKHSLSWTARDEVTMHYQNANSHQQTGSVMPLPIAEAVSTPDRTLDMGVSEVKMEFIS